MSKTNNTENIEPATQSGDKTSESRAFRMSPSLVDKFVIRLPKGLRTQIKALSEQNRRSMNSEIIMVLEKHIQQWQEADMNEFRTDEFMNDTHMTSAAQGEQLGDQENEVKAGERAEESAEVSAEESKQDALNRRLEALPPEKKKALLELLG